MKIFMRVVLIVCFAVCFTNSLFSQRVLFKDVKVTPRWVPSPGINGNVIQRGNSSQDRWLQVDVDFTSIVLQGQPWLDDVVVKYDILLPQTTSRKVVLSGQTQYWSIAMNGQQHHVQSFIHPRFLQRYAPGLKMNSRDLKDLRILVTFLQNDSIVAMGVYKPSVKASPVAIKGEIDKALQDRRTFKGKESVFSRDETPWGVLNVDYYELIKRRR